MDLETLIGLASALGVGGLVSRYISDVRCKVLQKDKEELLCANARLREALAKRGLDQTELDAIEKGGTNDSSKA